MFRMFCVVVVGLLSLGPDVGAAELVMPSRGICAHRGAHQTHPENTLAAFREAIRLGAHQIELDVQFTADRQLAIMHDATVSRTTDGFGPVADFTLAELKKLDAGIKKGPQFAGERIPTLAESLEIMPRNVWINVHLKDDDAALGEAVVREVVRQNRQYQAFLTGGAAMAVGARRVLPEIMICSGCRGDHPGAIDAVVRHKCRFVQLVGPMPSPEDMKRLKTAGIRVNLFGAETPEQLKQPGWVSSNDPAALKSLYEMGIDFPLADRLAEMLEAAEALGVEPLEPVY